MATQFDRWVASHRESDPTLGGNMWQFWAFVIGFVVFLIGLAVA